MSLTPEMVTVQRPVQTKDAAGGNKTAPQTIFVGPATRNYYRSAGMDEQRSEQGDHNTAGPGIVEERRQFLCFETAKPGAKKNDQVVLADGTTWLVLYARDYSDSTAINVQVDIELIQ